MHCGAPPGGAPVKPCRPSGLHGSEAASRGGPTRIGQMVVIRLFFAAPLVWFVTAGLASLGARLLVNQSRARSRYAASLVSSRPSSFTSNPSTLDASDAVNE